MRCFVQHVKSLQMEALVTMEQRVHIVTLLIARIALDMFVKIARVVLTAKES